ncbi:hypothetical protein [Zoogloea sp.]|uniref:DinB/UmuC family translesion DNA polymerase n=1 Tax=Zoogloea sp. TaxID=49181 RepID=UPI0035AFF22F
MVGAITVMIGSNPFKPWEPQYNRSEVAPLPAPSADTRELIQAALWGLRRIYRSGYAYKKAGVMLSGLKPVQRRQGSLLVDPERERKSAALIRPKPPNRSQDAMACQITHRQNLKTKKPLKNKGFFVFLGGE